MKKAITFSTKSIDVFDKMIKKRKKEKKTLVGFFQVFLFHFWDKFKTICLTCPNPFHANNQLMLYILSTKIFITN